MPPPEPSAYGPVYDVAVLLLAQLVAGYAAAGVDLPERRYVTPGVIPAYDDAQLTVSVQALRVGTPGQQLGVAFASCPPVRYVTLRVELIRCTPSVESSGGAPSVEALLPSAQEVLRDLVLVDTLVRDSRTFLAGKGDPSNGVGVPVAMGNTAPVGPDGGLSGVRVDIDVPV